MSHFDLMKTQIYKTHRKFLDRADKKLNGVSPSFARAHPDYEKENQHNRSCWNCYDCYSCFRSARCSGCCDCHDCYNSARCYACYGLTNCCGCSGLTNAGPVAREKGKSWFDVPVIPNIHQKVFAAASAPKAFDMEVWHSCDTMHCRGGWVVFLAGNKGRKLELANNTLFAAMQIYHASNPSIPVSPARFFESKKVAMADMKRCAELEAKA